MALKPVKATVFVVEANETVVFYVNDENTLFDLWRATKYADTKTGFVSGWVYLLEDPDFMKDAKREYWSINVSKISNVKWEVEEVEDEKPRSDFFV